MYLQETWRILKKSLKTQKQDDFELIFAHLFCYILLYSAIFCYIFAHLFCFKCQFLKVFGLVSCDENYNNHSTVKQWRHPIKYKLDLVYFNFHNSLIDGFDKFDKFNKFNKFNELVSGEYKPGYGNNAIITGKNVIDLFY